MRGSGGGLHPQWGARGAKPARMRVAQMGFSRVRGRAHSHARSNARALSIQRSKDNKESTQVAIRDLFCKRRRAMLQYGTPDWARPCLARLLLSGAFVLAQLVLKRIGADHLQTLAQPQHAVLCLGARLGMAGCFPLSIWFRYPQKGARATKLSWAVSPTMIPFLIC